MTEIARLNITLEDVEPPVRRRVEVPVSVRLDRLHLVIQAAMGWENYHLYEFQVSRTIAYGIPDPDWPEPGRRSVTSATLADLIAELQPDKTFQYLYDFGDDWLHTIKLEAVAAADPKTTYPRLISAEGRCPPEDCGGPPGYEHYLEAIADPDHEDHDEMIGWRGPGFDPTTVDEDAIRKALAELARTRRRKSAR